MKKLFLVSLVIVVTLTGCSLFQEESAVKERIPEISDRVLEFEDCGINECGTLEVPMDYDNPDGRKISINLVKVPALKPQERIGVIFVNPGGPGAAGAEFVSANSSFLFPQEILDKFDIIGWDPRGSGKSTGVTCNENLDPLFEDVDYSPQSEQGKAALIEATKWVGQECEKEDAELLPFLKTEDTVFDLEAIRIALGEDQINFLGYSYGTVIGQIYATHFPDQVRTMVLDGVADTTLEPRVTAREQALGFESAMNSFFEFCRVNRCQFSGQRDPKTVYIELIEKVRNTNLTSTTDPSLKLGPAQFDIGTAQYLYSGEDGWRTLDRGLASLANNDNPGILLDGFNQYVGRSNGGIYSGMYIAFLSIGCADGNIGSVDEMFDLANELKGEAQIFGESGILLGLPCAQWPGATKSEKFELDTRGSGPIVVIGTTGDPATPVQWARNVANQIENSVYIEKVGEGHTIYGRGDVCIDSVVNDYFITATKPQPKTC